MESVDEFELEQVYTFLEQVFMKTKFGFVLEGEIGQIEEWGIVQGFAIDGIGGGFFSQKNLVFNLRDQLQSLYDLPDKAYFNSLLEGANLMKRNFQTLNNLVQDTGVAQRKHLDR